jgi:PAS domain S-box-containing protein
MPRQPWWAYDRARRDAELARGDAQDECEAREASALQIQSAVRGRRARADMARSAGTVLGTIERQMAPFESLAADLRAVEATRLQCWWRRVCVDSRLVRRRSLATRLAIHRLRVKCALPRGVARARRARLPPLARLSPPSRPMRRRSSEVLEDLLAPNVGIFERWVKSRACEAAMGAWGAHVAATLRSEERAAAARRALFHDYPVPADCAGWLTGLAILAETLPIAFTVSDPTIAGFPLVFVNGKFVEVSGYSKAECYGRNCRFLQGPGTNPAHGQKLKEDLRDGSVSQTLLENYRKNGEMFVNMLIMRYVHDSNGRRRFCIGMQLDLTGLSSDDGPWGKDRLATASGQQLIADASTKMRKLITMLPRLLNVPILHVPRTSGRADWAPSDPVLLADPHLVAMRDSLGLSGVEAGSSWTDQFALLSDQLPHAMILVDMQVPGLPICQCNRAFTELTGWAAHEAVGRNCRFLQCAETETIALSNLIDAVRTDSRAEVRITNQRRDGSTFVNDLSLHPVHDSTGVYRYNIGVLDELLSPTAREEARVTATTHMTHMIKLEERDRAASAAMAEASRAASTAQTAANEASDAARRAIDIASTIGSEVARLAATTAALASELTSSQAEAATAAATEAALEAAAACAALSAAPGTPVVPGSTSWVASIAALRRALPTQFDVHHFPPSPNMAVFKDVDPVVQWRAHQLPTAKMMRLLWLTDPDGALRKLLELLRRNPLAPTVTQAHVLALLRSFLTAGAPAGQAGLPEDVRVMSDLISALVEAEDDWDESIDAPADRFGKQVHATLGMRLHELEMLLLPTGVSK